jgi:hypothetical protein
MRLPHEFRRPSRPCAAWTLLWTVAKHAIAMIASNMEENYHGRFSTVFDHWYW